MVDGGDVKLLRGSASTVVPTREEVHQRRAIGAARHRDQQQPVTIEPGEELIAFQVLQRVVA